MKLIRPIVAGLAGALLLAGCGAPTASEPPASQAAPTTEPAESTAASPTAAADSSVEEFLGLISSTPLTTYSMDMTMNSEIQGNALDMTSSGKYDNTDPDQPSSHITMNVGGLEMEAITVAGDYYLKMGLTGDQWLKMDASSAEEMSGPAGPDLSNWAEQSKDTIESVELVGDDTVGDVPAKHYKLTMKPEALRELGVDDAGGAGATATYDVWIDADGFTRRFDAVVTGGPVPTEISATLDNINKPVDIKAPKDWVEAPE